MKRTVLLAMAAAMVLYFAACGNGASQMEKQTEANEGNLAAEGEEEVELQVFIAASLNTVMTDLANRYREDHPHVKITFNAESSGTLMMQIEEGFSCDIFFSAAQKQMDQLEADGFVVEGSRANVVNNQVVVV